MNPDRRGTRQRRPFRLRGSAGGVTRRPMVRAVEHDDVAPWVVAAVRDWPGSVEDRLVAVRMGVQPDHVRLARQERPAA